MLYCPNVFGPRHAKVLYCPNVFGSRHAKNAVLSQSFRLREAKTLYCPKKTKKPTFLRVSSSKIGTVQGFCFSEPERLGQYSTSGPPGVEHAVLSQCFLGPGMQKRCTVPKNSKKLIFSGSPGQRLGQCGVFASLSQKDWDSTALQALQVQKTLYCPNVFGSRHATKLYCPKKLKQPNLFRVSRSKIGTVRSQQDWDSTALQAF